MSLRTLLIVVAMVGTAIGVERRWASFRRLAEYHAEEAFQCQMNADTRGLHLRLDDPVEEARFQAAERAHVDDLKRRAADHRRLSEEFGSRWQPSGNRLPKGNAIHPVEGGPAIGHAIRFSILLRR